METATRNQCGLWGVTPALGAVAVTFVLTAGGCDQQPLKIYRDGPAVTECDGEDLRTSATNCGICGRWCHGGACADGMCETETVAGTSNATSIAITRSNVSFTTGDEVRACPVTGCVDPPALMAQMTWATSSIVASKDLLFFVSSPAGKAERPTVFSCALNGCGTQPTPVSKSHFSVDLVTAAAEEIYWHDKDSGTFKRTCSRDAATCGEIQKVATADIEGPFSSIAFPRPFAVSVQRFFFVDDGGLHSCPLSGCDAGISFEFDARPSELAATGSTVFAKIDGTSGPGDAAVPDQIRRFCSDASCTDSVVLQASSPIAGLTADTRGLYWIEGSTIRTLAFSADAQPLVLATGQSPRRDPFTTPRPLVTDSDFVYWIDEPTGNVRRVAK